MNFTILDLIKILINIVLYTIQNKNRPQPCIRQPVSRFINYSVIVNINCGLIQMHKQRRVFFRYLVCSYSEQSTVVGIEYRMSCILAAEVQTENVPGWPIKTGSTSAGRAQDYNYIFITMTRLRVGNRSTATFLYLYSIYLYTCTLYMAYYIREILETIIYANQCLIPSHKQCLSTPLGIYQVLLRNSIIHIVLRISLT